MKTKNISIDIRKNKNVPFKETYVVFYKKQDKVRIVQKFIDPAKNQAITLNFKECKRLMNLLHEYLFDETFVPKHGRMEIFKHE